MAKLSVFIFALATTTTVLEARAGYEFYQKNGDPLVYDRDQRVNSYNDYAERRERQFGFDQKSGSFSRRPSVNGAIAQQPGSGRQPIYGQPNVVISNPPAVHNPNTGFGQQTVYARQYPEVYTPGRQVTHLSVRNRPGASGYGYDAYGQ